MIQRFFPAHDFVEFEPTEDLPRDFVAIDTVVGAKDVVLIRDVDKFVQTRALSLHDFDLSVNLKLAKKMGWLRDVVIIGIPPDIPESAAVEKVSNIIASLSAGSVPRSSCKGRKP